MSDTSPPADSAPDDQDQSTERKLSFKRVKSFGERFLRGQVKLPIIWVFLLAIVEGAPDWNSRYVFWLQEAKAAGGYFGKVAEVLLWPYASSVIAGLGVIGMLAFEARDRKLARNGPSVAFAWASLVVCVAAVGCTALYGYVQIYIKREIASGIAGLPRNTASLADTTRPQKPLVTASRVLQPDQSRVLLQVLPNLKPLLPSIIFMFDNNDPETYEVVAGFQKVFSRSGITTSSMFRQPSGPNDTGIRIVIPDIAHVSEAAEALKRDLEVADVRTAFEQYSATPITGSFIYPVGLHIAPAPIQ